MPPPEPGNIRPPWYQNGLHFTCTQCGNCCGGAPGYVWVEDHEIQAIAAYLGIDPAEFRRQHTRRAGPRRSLHEHPDGDCVFLERLPNGKSACAIHPVRPLQCRTWPFWKSNLRSQHAWDRAARNCPGMNTGQHHPLPVIQAALRENTLRDLPL